MEYGSQASSRPSQDQDAAIPGLELQKRCHNRAKPRAYLGNRSFFPRRAATADHYGRSQNFDKRHALTDKPAPLVKGLDHGIGAFALSLRGGEIHQQARNQPSQRRNDQKPPGVDRRQDRHRLHPHTLQGFDKPGGELQKMIQGVSQKFFKENGPQA